MGFRRPSRARRSRRPGLPVLIHLIQRERKRVVEFPSLMFLRKIPYQSVRRRRIRDWLLLLMRLAALALIVLAFARPFFKRDDAGRRGAERRARGGHPRRYVLQHGIRRSLAEGEGRRDRRDPRPGPRRSRLARVLLVGRRSRGPIGRRSRPARGGRWPPRRPVLARHASRRRLKLAGSLLGESALPRREIILISDFQRRGWEQTPGRDDVKLPERTTLTPVNVGVGGNRQPVGHAGLAAAHALRESRSRRRSPRAS